MSEWQLSEPWVFFRSLWWKISRSFRTLAESLLVFGWVKMFSAQSKRKITVLKCQAARLTNQSWSWIIEKPVDCKFSCPFLLGVSMTTLCAAVVIAAIIVEVIVPLFPLLEQQRSQLRCLLTFNFPLLRNGLIRLTVKLAVADMCYS